MKSLFKLNTFFSLLVVMSCGHTFETDSYITSFHEIEKIDAKAALDTIGTEEYARVDVYLKKGYKTVGVFDKDAKKQKQYRELCGKHNDLSYRHRWLSLSSDRGTDMLASFPLNDIQSVSLVTNTEFSPAYKAGNSLGNITFFVGASVNPYIQSGYKPFDYDGRVDELSVQFCHVWYEHVWPSVLNEQHPYPIDKMLSDVQANDLKLIGIGNVCEARMEDGWYLTYKPDVNYLGHYPEDEWIYNYFSLLIPLKDCTADRLKLSVSMTDEAGNQFETQAELMIR